MISGDSNNLDTKIWKRRSCRCSIWAVSLMMLVGCSQASNRAGLGGMVTLDGEPLAEGIITFRPQPGSSGPTAGATISDGRFSVSNDKGVFAGTFRVEITANRKTGRKVKDPVLGMMIDERKQIIPACYNRQSELTAEVNREGPNQFKFVLDF
jgi:hypothetical protein